MTPPGPQPYPPGPAGGDPGLPSPSRDLIAGALVLLGTTLGGLALGALWWWLAPRVPLISDGKDVFLKDPEAEDAIARDGWFALLALGGGAVSAVVVFWRCRRGGIPVVVALAVGGVLASLVGWRFGVWLGPSDDVAARAVEVGAGKVFDAPVKLDAKAALLAWPIAAMIVHLLLTGALGPRDPEPGAGKWTGWAQPVDPRYPAYPPPQAGQPQQPPPYGPPPHNAAAHDPWAAPRPPQQH